MLVWLLLYVRHRFVPITVKKLVQMDLEFIVPTNGNRVIMAKLLPEQCASVSFIVGVMGINECTTELAGREDPPEAEPLVFVLP